VASVFATAWAEPVTFEGLIHSHRGAGDGPSPFINRLVNTHVQGALMNDQQLTDYLFQLVGRNRLS
jgi:hypothetical protein